MELEGVEGQGLTLRPCLVHLDIGANNFSILVLEFSSYMLTTKDNQQSWVIRVYIQKLGNWSVQICGCKTQGLKVIPSSGNPYKSKLMIFLESLSSNGHSTTHLLEVNKNFMTKKLIHQKLSIQKDGRRNIDKYYISYTAAVKNKKICQHKWKKNTLKNINFLILRRSKSTFDWDLEKCGEWAIWKTEEAL